MREESAGVIPIHKGSEEILLVHHIAGHWGFPKGHIEGKETPMQTALRELREETGLTKVELKNKPLVKHYFFEKDGVCI